MNITDLIISSIVIFSLLIVTWYSGSIVSKYFFKQNNLLALPLGFLAIITIFHLFSLPFMVVNAKYEFVYIPFVIFLISTTIYSLKKIIETKMVQQFFSSKFNIFVLLAATLYGIYLFIFSIPYIDSWLYAPLATMSSESGYIYSVDGITDYIDWVHATDSYYLFQNCLASVSNIDPLLFISTFFKFFEGFMVVFTIAYFAKMFFKEFRLVFYLSLLGVVFWFGAFTNNYGINIPYIPIFLVHMTATGTIMLYIITIPTIILLFLKNNVLYKESYFWLLLTIFSFAVSSSALYIIPFGIFTVMIVTYLIDKEIKLKVFMPALLFCLFEVTVFIAPEKQLLLIISTLIIILIGVVFEKYCNKFFEKILFFSSIILFISILLLSSYINDVSILGNLFNAEIALIMVIGIIFLYKEDKRLMSFLLIAAFLWNNLFMITIIENTSLAPTYHRIEMLSSLYLFTIFGVIYLIRRFMRQNYLKYVSITVLTFIIVYSSISAICPVNNLEALNIRHISNYQNFYEFKMYYPDVYYFGNYDYVENSSIQFNLDMPENNIDFAGIVAMNPTLTITNNCVENCYIIQEKDGKKAKGSDIVYENDKYELLYIGEK